MSDNEKIDKAFDLLKQAKSSNDTEEIVRLLNEGNALVASTFDGTVTRDGKHRLVNNNGLLMLMRVPKEK